MSPEYEAEVARAVPCVCGGTPSEGHGGMGFRHFGCSECADGATDGAHYVHVEGRFVSIAAMVSDWNAMIADLRANAAADPSLCAVCRYERGEERLRGMCGSCHYDWQHSDSDDDERRMRARLQGSVAT